MSRNIQKRCFKIVVILTVQFCLISNAFGSNKTIILGHNSKNEDTMTKIVYRHLVLNKAGTLNEIGPCTLYLYSDKYVRLENPQSDSIDPMLQLMIISGPEIWCANPVTQQAAHKIRDEHLADCHLSIFPEAAQAEQYKDLYFGNELKYFLSHKAKGRRIETNEMNGSQFVLDNDNIEIKFTIQNPNLENPADGLAQIEITFKGQIIHKYLFDEYDNTLEVDRSLFSLPANIKTIYEDEKAIQEYRSQKEREKRLLETADDPQQYNELWQRWILACSGVLWQRNHDDFITLAGEPITEERIISRKRLLAEWWDIHSRKELYATLIWLTQEGGHRIDFEKIGKKISGMTPAEYQTWISQTAEDPEKVQEIRIAEQYYDELGSKSIAGWDYCRYICLCRWGYSCGYIEENEAWFLMTSAAKEIQNTFKSWAEYGQNYLIGRQFWSHEYTLSEGNIFTTALNDLTQQPDSPWKVLPWKLDLSKHDQ